MRPGAIDPERSNPAGAGHRRRGVRPDSLGELIESYIKRDGRSLNRIAQAGLIDVGYLWRLRAGVKRSPSRDTLVRLALALRLEPEELDELLVAADYAPITWRRF